MTTNTHPRTTFHPEQYKTRHVETHACAICDGVILEDQYWFPGGCPVRGTTCNVSNTPIHVNCWVHRHILTGGCKDLEPYLLQQPSPSSTTTHQRCYYWTCQTKDDTPGHDLKILRCPLSSPGCDTYSGSKSNEFVHVNCWIDRHVYVCENFLDVYKKGCSG